MKTPRLPTDELFQVERQIARRADELTRCFGSDPVHALEHWRQAEREFWSHDAEESAMDAMHEHSARQASLAS
jgi:hypothetical protein